MQLREKTSPSALGESANKTNEAVSKNSQTVAIGASRRRNEAGLRTRAGNPGCALGPVTHAPSGCQGRCPAHLAAQDRAIVTRQFSVANFK